MLLICLLGDYPVWIVSWILMAIGYYLVLKRMGLSKWACVIPGCLTPENAQSQ